MAQKIASIYRLELPFLGLIKVECMATSPIIADLLSFLDASPTAWHAVSEASKRLKQQGFQELKEEDSWMLTPGGRYHVTRNGSSLCAFTLPRGNPNSATILASHTDSPALKLKPYPEIRKQNMILFGVEVYGSPLLSSWLNRDLGLAGRVIYSDDKGHLRESLVTLNKHSLIIPQLAIHLDRDANEKGLILNKQDHLSVLAAIDQGNTSGSYLERLLKELIPLETLIRFELFLYPLEHARLIGWEGQMISSYRIDSLASVQAALTAFLQMEIEAENHINMIVFWDNEEVGSSTSQGAGSPFLPETLERITLALKKNREEYFRLLRRSLCVSIDLAHAWHPNYPEKHDAQHQPLMGKGVVLKTNAQQRYASDGRLFALLDAAAKKAGVNLQTFVSRNDIIAGSTIGPIQATLTGIPTVDIGSGQLSMHSSRELTSCQDHLSMISLLKSILHG
jgi:aspartyl aminopeptidase